MIPPPRYHLPWDFSILGSFLYGTLRDEYNHFFSTYRTYQRYLQDLETIAINNSSFVDLDFSQHSTEHRSMPLARLGYDPSSKKPSFLLTGMIHGRECISGEVCFGMAERIIAEDLNGSSDLLQHVTVYCLPVINPDAFVYNEQKMLKGRRFGQLQRQNACGVDLNRNFPDNFEKRSWTNRKNHFTRTEYAGEFPFSEQETRALRTITWSKKFSGVINFHSFSNVILYPPWSTQETNTILEELAQEISAAMPEPYTPIQGSRFIKYASGRLSPMVTRVRHPTIEGSFDGWLYKRGIPSMVVEISKPTLPLAALSNLYAFNPPPSSLSQHINNCYPMVKRFMGAIAKREMASL